MSSDKKSTRFQPGQSGNPAGRKPGTGEIARLRAAISKHVPAILDSMVEQAKAGDVQAARLLLERALAPLKAQETAQALALPDDGTLTEQARAVLAAVANGQLAPGQGSQLLSGIATMARVVVIDELADRVARLEQQHGKS